MNLVCWRVWKVMATQFSMMWLTDAELVETNRVILTGGSDKNYVVKF